MQTAKFEIECSEPEIIIKAVKFEDQDNVVYEIINNKLILNFTANDIKTLIKSAYSTCKKVELAINTIEKFKK